MSTFMHEGGVAMWVMLVVALIAGGLAIYRRKSSGSRTSLQGALAVLGFGVMGFSTGLYATVAAAGRVAATQSTEILMIGIRESANNTVFGAALALCLLLMTAVLNSMARRSAGAAA